ncbi:MAG: protein kinase [Sandaracinaceae bacterium]
MSDPEASLRATRRGPAALRALLATRLYPTRVDVAEAGARPEPVETPCADDTVRLPGGRGDARSTPGRTAPEGALPAGRPPGWGARGAQVRSGVAPDEAELLRLRYARGLDPVEIASVLGVEGAQVARRLDAAAAYVRLLAEGHVADVGEPSIAALLADAFRGSPPADRGAVEPAMEPATVDGPPAEPVAAPLPPGTRVGGRYEIVERIGGGAFAFVYRARDVRVPGHVVALKLLHRAARSAAEREGALRELTLIASAFHPSLVQLKDHGWVEDRLWFVMPFYEGESLLERLERGPLPLDEALGTFERLARALAALHAAGVRHQDVKPENIFLARLATGAPDGSAEVLPVLLDLGVAAPDGNLALAGTPMYLAPEIASRIVGEGCAPPLTPKADVLALALSLAHALEPPDPPGPDAEPDVDAFLRRRAKAPPEGPRSARFRRLRAPFRRWMAADPAERPTAGELADELADLRATHRTAEQGSMRVRRGARWSILAMGVAAVTVALTLQLDEVVGPLAGETGAERSAGDPDHALRLLRGRVRAEEHRAAELERALAAARAEELGVGDGDGDEAQGPALAPGTAEAGDERRTSPEAVEPRVVLPEAVATASRSPEPTRRRPPRARHRAWRRVDATRGRGRASGSARDAPPGRERPAAPAPSSGSRPSGSPPAGRAPAASSRVPGNPF